MNEGRSHHPYVSARIAYLFYYDPMGRPKINLVGEQFGALKVVAEASERNGRTAWLCECQCGEEVSVRTADLRGGKQTHCSHGCPRRDQRGITNERLLAELERIAHHFQRPKHPLGPSL
jgi:hypothetical protein